MAILPLFLGLAVAIALTAASGRPARACGGGVVTTQTAGSIGANAQRIIVSFHDGVTDVVTEIGVPSTTADYGVLIPVPGQPILDAKPVPSADIDALDQATAPRILVTSHDDDDGFSCGCPLSGGAAGGDAVPIDGGAQVTQLVTIGPVVAVVLTADTGDAVAAWLAQSGFVVPAGAQPVVDAYAGPGRYFVAIRRADGAATGSPSSIGVHFRVTGDQRVLPLRFARIGAADQVAFTIFVASDQVVGPAAPFTGIRLNQLDRQIVRTAGYAAAVAAAVAKQGNHAFVIESAYGRPSVGPTLGAVLLANQVITRLATILPAAALEGDVALTAPISTAGWSNDLYVDRTPARVHRSIFAVAGTALLALGVVVTRRRPRR